MMSYAQRCVNTGRACSASVGSSRRFAVTVRASADSKFDGFKPSVAAFFPGQGAQSVGMAKDLVAEVPKAKEMFDKAKEILGYDLLQVDSAIERLRGSTHHSCYSMRSLDSNRSQAAVGERRAGDMQG